jgi:hypothetical protein
MQGVEFDEEPRIQKPHILYGKFEPGTKAPGLINFLMKHGVKSEAVANGILVALFIFAVVLSIFVYIYFVQGPQPIPLRFIHR